MSGVLSSWTRVFIWGKRIGATTRRRPSRSRPRWAAAGGAGGGGKGSSSNTAGVAGTTNTGGGGGGGEGSNPTGHGYAGGSGIVALRYVTACASACASGGDATATCGSDTIRVFIGDGTFTA